MSVVGSTCSRALATTREGLQGIARELAAQGQTLERACPSNRLQLAVEDRLNRVWRQLPHLDPDWAELNARPVRLFGLGEPIVSPQWNILCLAGRIQIQGLRLILALSSQLLIHPVRTWFITAPSLLNRALIRLVSGNVDWLQLAAAVAPFVTLGLKLGTLPLAGKLESAILALRALQSASRYLKQRLQDRREAQITTLLAGPLLQEEREDLQMERRRIWQQMNEEGAWWAPVVDALQKSLAFQIATGLPVALLGTLGWPMLGIRISALLGVGALLAPRDR
jgi:hypothetical protein